MFTSSKSGTAVSLLLLPSPGAPVCRGRKARLVKRQKKLQDQSLEIQKFEEKIHHLADMNISIDLDDGVKHNYALFSDVLAKIK